MNAATIGMLVVGGLVFVVASVVVLSFLNLYILALFSGVRVSVHDLIRLKLMKLSPGVIVRSHIQATKAGLNISLRDLEIHSLAGGSPARVVDALIAAREAGVRLDYDAAAMIDLMGRDILKTVRDGVYPGVLNAGSGSAAST